jgi:hypothetical protein
MGGSNQVNIMATAPLELEHYRRQLWWVYWCTLPQMADLEILTKRAAKTTEGEEDGP